MGGCFCLRMVGPRGSNSSRMQLPGKDLQHSETNYVHHLLYWQKEELPYHVEGTHLCLDNLGFHIISFHLIPQQQNKRKLIIVDAGNQAVELKSQHSHLMPKKQITLLQANSNFNLL